MPDVNVEELQRISQRNFGLDLNGGLRLQTGINKDANGIAQQLYGKDLNASLVSLKTLIGGRVARLNGTSAYIDTPHHTSLAITGDIDLRFEFLDNRNPAVSNVNLISKNGGAGQRSYTWWDINIFSLNQLLWSADGTATLTADFAPADTRMPKGARRVTLDVASGANRVITWYDSTSITGTWTQRSQLTTAGNTSLFNASTTPITIGATNGGGGDFFNGDITRVEIRNGIDGTVVANPDFRFLAPGTTSFTDAAGRTWTLRGGAVII